MIEVTCIGFDASYELNNVAHLFEPWVTEPITIQTEVKDSSIEITLMVEGETKQTIHQSVDQIMSESDELKYKKELKRVLKEQVYCLLSAYSNKKMPWGILTGIRPTKIVHDYFEKGMDEVALREKLEKSYHISKEKVQLMVQVAKEEEKILKGNKPNEINVYIGIPFCPTRCVYCSFTAYSIEAKQKHVENYLQALFKEISFIGEAQQNNPIRSLYIGGGTPTSLDEEQLERLLAHVEATFDLGAIEEYTIEAGRPDTINREKLRIMKKYGVGRISINPQSMNQVTLDSIGRHHSVEAIREVFAEAREEGHDNINMDVILGLPGETPEDVAYTLSELKKLNPENITVHTMAIKKASKLHESKEGYVLTETNKIEKMLTLCEEMTKEMGLVPYYMYRQKNMLGNFENVGYAKPGYECIYNVEIMEEKQSIIAAGAGAITKMVYEQGERIDRVPNVKSLEDYITRIDEMIERKREGFKKYR